MTSRAVFDLVSQTKSKHRQRPIRTQENIAARQRELKLKLEKLETREKRVTKS